MKNLAVIIFLSILLVFFSIFIRTVKQKYEVLDILDADKITVDLNHNGIKDNNENICVSGIKSFPLNPDKKFKEKYQKQYNISDDDFLNLWYLSKDFGQKNILNKKVSVKFSDKENSECRYAGIKIENIDYSDLLYNNSYGFRKNKIYDKNILKKHIENGKNLNLVILNHHSNKYHKPNCEYAHLAHDTVIIPLKQLPKDSKPCKFCYQINNKLSKNNKSADKITTANLFTPNLITSDGEIKTILTDYTKHLKPNSNCNSYVCREFVQLINNTKSTIDIAIYGYEDNPAITLALKNAKNRGIQIRFIHDESPQGSFYKNNDTIAQLAQKSKNDRQTPEAAKIMHNKFVIFDDEIVFTGSMNFSKSGLSEYDVNDIIIIRSKPIAELYTMEFEQMLAGKFHNAKTKHNVPNTFNIGNSTVEVYFSPQDKSSQRIIQLINQAKSYIYIPSFLITHAGITEALINAHSKGIDVKIIIDANSIHTRNTKHKLLRDKGIQLKAENYAGKLHSKAIIIDNMYLITGSMNLSNSGENKNDENLLIIKNPKIAALHKNFFLYLWKIIPDKYLKYNPKAESPDSIGSCYDGIDNNFDGKIDSADDGCKIK